MAKEDSDQLLRDIMLMVMGGIITCNIIVFILILSCCGCFWKRVCCPTPQTTPVIIGPPQDVISLND